MDVVWGIRRIYSIAREGVWGREGLAAAACQRLADFSSSLLEAVFARGNKVNSILAALGVVLVALGLILSFLVVLRAVLDRSWEVLGRS